MKSFNASAALRSMRLRSFPGIKKDAYEKRIIFDGSDFDVRGAKYQILRFNPRDSIGEHWHAHTTELYLVRSGRAIVRVNGRKRVLAKDDCILLHPGDRHAIENPFSNPFVFHLFKWNESRRDLRWPTPPPAPRSLARAADRAR